MSPSLRLPELSTKSRRYMDMNGIIRARMDRVHLNTDGRWVFGLSFCDWEHEVSRDVLAKTKIFE